VTIRRLSVLQWFGIGGAALAVVGQFFAGASVTAAACNPGSSRWGVPSDTIQIALAAAGIAIVLAAEAAAVVVYRATRGTEEQDPPPQGRLHFFATAALAANAIFLMIIVLSFVAAVSGRLCRQA
jgi:hypothetical protein